jgi:hypothetical protein
MSANTRRSAGQSCLSLVLGVKSCLIDDCGLFPPGNDYLAKLTTVTVTGQCYFMLNLSVLIDPPC